MGKRDNGIMNARPLSIDKENIDGISDKGKERREKPS